MWIFHKGSIVNREREREREGGRGVIERSELQRKLLWSGRVRVGGSKSFPFLFLVSLLRAVGPSHSSSLLGAAAADLPLFLSL